MKLQSQKNERKIVPFGTYLLEYLDIEEVENRFKAKDSDDTHQWCWKFRFQDPDGETQELWGYTGRTFGRDRDGNPYKARSWAEALLKRTLTDAEANEMDSEILEGTRAWGKVNDVNKDGKPANVILGLAPYKPNKPSPDERLHEATAGQGRKQPHGFATSVEDFEPAPLPLEEDF